jgi:hypothetical protein
VADHQRERATTLDPDALLERGDVRSRKERLESDVAVAIDARGGTAVVLELAETRDVRRRAEGVVPRDGDPAKNGRPRGRPRLRGEGRQCNE